MCGELEDPKDEATRAVQGAKQGCLVVGEQLRFTGNRGSIPLLGTVLL